VEVSEQARVIAGRYELQSLIGEGGMASVWRARDLTLERPVAVKLLFARDERDKHRLIQQFVREARIAASVHHRNVIHIVDFGTTEAQQPFMVMELLEGETLGHRLHREPRLSLPEIVQIAALTLRGLAAVHDAGIIHRDLKPENVFLSTDGGNALFPKILDFGISRSVEPRSGRRSALTTREGMIVGTPEYMSPEQARGVRGIDKRTDLYSMGAILYEALTGRLAFASENVGDLIIQIVTGTAQTIHELEPKVPRAISDVVAKAMARQPEDRFSDALAMQHALLLAAQSLDGSSTLALTDPPPGVSASIESPRLSVSQDRLRTLEFPIGQPAAAQPMVSAPAASSVDDLDFRPRARGARTLVIGTLALGIATGAAGLLLTRGPEARVSGSSAGARAALGATVTASPPLPGANPVAEQSATITVSLLNVPKTALVFVDGKAAEGATLELPRDGRNRVIKVTAPGKIPWQAVHHASADASFDVELVERESTASASRGSKPLETGRASSTSQKKAAHKKPPSALRRLDF
jgi:serine/threonine-protein kinase